jgi:hypothetical protein
MYFGYYVGLWEYKIYNMWEKAKGNWMQIRYKKTLQRSKFVENANLEAMRNYRPIYYPGPVHFFYASLQARYDGDTLHNGWDELALDGLVVHELNCYHGNLLFEPFVGQVAEILNRYIDIRDWVTGFRAWI